VDQTPLPAFTDPNLAADDNVGKHNLLLEQSQLRVIQGGTWKRADVVILLPAADMVPLRCAMSWMNMITPPNNGCVRIGCLGDEVGVAYSNALEQVLSTPGLAKFPYLLTLEHDNAPPPDGILKLVKHMEMHPEFDAISGLYWTKGDGGVPQIWGDINDPVVNYRAQPPRVDGGLVECYGIGMGFVLWRLDMFKDPALRKPWFKTVCSPEEGVGTQDLYFWNNARQQGYRCAVACDVLVGHWDQNTKTMW
jgi:hypothetical protein